MDDPYITSEARSNRGATTTKVLVLNGVLRGQTNSGKLLCTYET